MPTIWRKTLFGIVGLLLLGLLIGWLYNAPLTGLLAASLAVVFYQLRQLFRFERSVANNDLDGMLMGEGIWSEIAARVSYLRQRVRKNKRRYRRLLKEVRSSTNAMPDGAVILNSLYQIVLCNKAAKRLAGVRPVQDRGQRIDNILRDPLFVKYLHKERSDRAQAVQIESPFKDDNWLSCRLVPFGAKQYLLLIRDVTDAVRINQVRRDFVSNASHELRSPLTVVSGYLDALADDASLSDDWKQPISQMRLQAERMNRIVAELLELSRLENPQAERDNEEIDIAALLALARREWAGRDGVPTIEVDASLTAKLMGVSSEIESVISNLLVNAIRHTPADGSIELAWNSDGADGAILSVTDTGEGIEEEYIPRLTERFFRVDPGRSRDAGGVGLGLAIVKHAVLRHDGGLHIASTLGQGSTFSCHFPASRLSGAELVSIHG